MSIGVIGGSGFIGSVLCKILNKKKLNFVIGDLNKSKYFKKQSLILDVRNSLALSKALKSCSVIINLAAEHRDNISPASRYDEVNVKGAKNICIAARSNNINMIIFTSSVAVYGFAKIGIDELGKINPFNSYGKSKWEAEIIYKSWQKEDPTNRTLVIIRPTVVFGEGNRGNVYNLFRQIASKKFIMVGSGKNRKSMAYVENVAAFLEYSLNFKPGIHIYNYVDKPDLTINSLVMFVKNTLGQSQENKFKIPFFIALIVGKFFDFFSFILQKEMTVSSVRVKKFCANSVYESAVYKTSFIPPMNLYKAIKKTITYEFLKK
jgi:nucleoside-diphosphate-sugar epimerase